MCVFLMLRGNRTNPASILTGKISDGGEFCFFMCGERGGGVVPWFVGAILNASHRETGAVNFLL